MNFKFKIVTRSLLALSTGVSLSFVILTPARAAEPSASPVPVASPAATSAASVAIPTATTASPSGVPVVSPSPSVAATLSASDKKKLLAEYARAQANQEKALQHTSRSELKQLQAAQGQRSRSWRESERKKRKDYFESHTSGPDRRTFVQDYLKRKKELDDAQKGDYEDAKKKWATKLEDLRKKQKDQALEFKSKVDQGQRPDSGLWPN